MKTIVEELSKVKAVHVLAALGVMWLVCELASVCLRALGVA